MSYQALYRVWRPQNFADVVGQSHITRTLKNAIVKEQFSHAYLFSGPRGTGKTSAAKIFAKAINCEKAPVEEPCGECSSCEGIQTGAISDVMEIDAASNNGVEQIRDIRDKVKYAPTAVRYKVYIIDEVHMLSIGAFNALLKTLEEPPKHVIFILATTEPHKIPLTIISRCQRFDFKRITQRTLIDRMKTVMNDSSIQIDEYAYQTIALAAEGGMRDALSLLDQAISYSEGQVTLDDVLAITGSVAQTQLTRLTELLVEESIYEALREVDQFIQNGKDPGRFIHDYIYFLRDLLVYQSAGDVEDLLERSMIDPAFKTLSDQLSPEWIQNAIAELNQCQQDMRWTNSPKVFIEIAILKLAETKTDQGMNDQQPEQILQLTKKLDKLEQELKQIKESPATKQQETASPKPQKRAPVSKNSYKIPHERIRDALERAEKPHLKTVHNQWPAFMQRLKQESAPAAATLQEAKPVAAASDVLIIAFRYDIHCSLSLDHKEKIENLLLELTSQPMTFIPIPEPAWQKVRQDFLAKQQRQETDSDSSQEETSSQEEDPLIAEARKLVGDDLLEIKDSQ
ncbi:DNA polymerase III, tau subunit [Pelagirhabdus alkalitolerans]|uniref:DNA-directed DNA polymerase n=1 Tax=Pelagirhabdus alkalitolerans TaxID=1612202 RepID=A0A1G6NFE5_9BACI|nr:DNA polymerase III subunit gamma/tau [Pelagirhabdus alkalitolerans]SDC66590.1 DNA polymerase III, tau subunit [Pelagirhabdus alkalitolerans]